MDRKDNTVLNTALAQTEGTAESKIQHWHRQQGQRSPKYSTGTDRSDSSPKHRTGTDRRDNRVLNTALAWTDGTALTQPSAGNVCGKQNNVLLSAKVPVDVNTPQLIQPTIQLQHGHAWSLSLHHRVHKPHLKHHQEINFIISTI